MRDNDMRGSTGGGADVGAGASVTGTSGTGTSQSAFKKYGTGGLKLVGLAVLFTVVSMGVEAAKEAIFHTKEKDRKANDEANSRAREDLAEKIGANVATHVSATVATAVGKGIAEEVVRGMEPSMDRLRDKIIDVNQSIVGLREGFSDAIENSTDAIVNAINKLAAAKSGEHEVASSGDRGNRSNRNSGG